MDNRYKILRKEYNLTQVELAKRVNVEQSAISKWELNKTIPDYLTLQKLAEIYNTTTDYLLGITDQREITEHKKHTYSELEKLFKDAGLTDEKLKTMSEDYKELAKDYLIMLAEKSNKK